LPSAESRIAVVSRLEKELMAEVTHILQNKRMGLTLATKLGAAILTNYRAKMAW
jgi:hypothetical protein